MDNKEIVEKIIVIANEILPSPKYIALLDYSFVLDDNWESIKRVDLINSLEEEFDITFKLKELTSWETMEQLSNIIIEKM